MRQFHFSENETTDDTLECGTIADMPLHPPVITDSVVF
jgi:hypothetical protein